MSELWENPLYTVEDRLEMAVGAIKFRDSCLAATKQQLAEALVSLNAAQQTAEAQGYLADMYLARAKKAEEAMKAEQKHRRNKVLEDLLHEAPNYFSHHEFNGEKIAWITRSSEALSTTSHTEKPTGYKQS